MVVSIAAPPKTGAESLQVGKVLKYLSRENSITLLTESINYNSWATANLSKDYTLPPENIIYVKSQWNRLIKKAMSYLNPSVFTGPDDKFLFVKSALKTRMSSQPDVIYSRSLPLSSSIAAYKLHLKTGVPWIMHLSDPWTINPYHKRGGTFHTEMERKCFEKAAIITLTTPEAVSAYKEKYPSLSAKFRCFPNVYDDELVSLNEVPESKNQKFKIVHAGNFYGSRNPESFLKALAILPEKVKKGIECIFAGHMDEYSLNIIKSTSAIDVKYLGGITYSEAQKLQQSADLLLAIDGDLNSDDAMFFPSKLLDYMVTGLPVLAITNVESPTYKFIHDRYGKANEHTDLKGIAINVQQFYEMKINGNASGTKKTLLDENYSAKKNVALLTEWMEEIC